MQGIGLKEIAFFGYAVTDFDRARKFYGEVLGLKESATYDHDGVLGWVEYDVAGQTLALALSSAEWLPSAHGGGICLEVADLEQAVAHLETHGVKTLSGIMSYPVCRLALISDPDGNTIALHQRKAEHPEYQP